MRRAYLISLGIHLAASPLAGFLGVQACPALEREGLPRVLFAMAVASATAWAAFWYARRGWSRLWRTAREGGELREDEVRALFRGGLHGVPVHLAAFVVATGVGALALWALFGHPADNPRFWFAGLLSAGCVILLNAALLEYLLARSLRGAATQRWSFRSDTGRFDLRTVILFGVATLPMGVLVALVNRRALDGRPLETPQLVMWMLELGAFFTAWSLAVVGLLRAVEGGAARQVLGLIRELHRPEIPVRARLVTGGAWGETAASLNRAAESLEQRARLETAVRTYVGDEVAEATRESDVTKSRGERVRMTVLFADIRGFTARSADRSPEEIVDLLDGYFAMAVDAVERHRGHVDKFIGDGLMCWFDERDGVRDAGAARAVASARDLLAGLGPLNARLAERGIAPIRIGVGLHAGDVVRGNLGAGRRKQFTVIGDTVNLASRVESMTKQLGRDLVFTRAVADAVDPREVEDLGVFEIRGQPVPVALCSLRTA